MTTQVYEIKLNKKWERVRATSIKALSDYAKQKEVKDWKMVGMMSREEMKESQKLQVVA